MKRDTWRSLIIVATLILGLYYLYPTYQFYFAPPTNPEIGLPRATSSEW